MWRIGERTLPSAAFGVVSFVALVLGYAIASQLRGFTYSPVLFGLVVVSGTTGWFYWSLIALTVAGAFFATYSAVGS